MQPILVIGATGTIGREVVSQLIERDAPVRALARQPDSAHLPAAVQVVQGDLTFPTSLHHALEDVHTVFLVWHAPRSAFAPVLAHLVQNVRRVVFLSAPHRTAHPFFQQPNPVAALHAEIERLVEDSPLEWTFLRPAMFAANFLRWWAPQIRAGDVVRWPYEHAPTAPVHERDIAAVAARVLLEQHHHGRDYVLTGPESLIQAEQLDIIGQVLGRALLFEEISPEEARRDLLPTIPLPAINMLLNAWHAALGQPAFLTSEIARITGRPARTFREWVADHANEFREPADDADF